VIRDGDVSWRPATDFTRLAAIAALALIGALKLLRS
jgi:hypothetical protein